MKLYKAKTTYDISGNVAAIQQDLMTNGPIEVAFDVYEDFFSYKSGVYTHKTGGLAGGHAVKLVGWGTDPKGGDYWIVANSWGTSWYVVVLLSLSASVANIIFQGHERLLLDQARIR
jgi:cathepsin B